MFTDPNDVPLPTAPDALGYYTRRVQDATVLDAPTSFRALCRLAVPREAGLIVLDLDKTCFLGLNMGELLGWELVARDAYGDARLDALEARGERHARKLFLDAREPGGSARYMRRAVSTWAWPGLSYLLGLSLPSRFGATERLLYRALGADPVQSVQAIPQMNLMHQLSRLPRARAEEFVARLLRRFSDYATITPDDIGWLRTWAPDATIAVASGSPSVVASVAAQWLGADLAVGTEIEEVDGVLSAPPFFRPFSADDAEPHRIAPLSSIHINTGTRKVARLTALMPELFASSERAPTVGITDTDHGEDHCWAEHFDHVVDVNSTAPFSPIVSATSPLRTIHSARLLDQRGRCAPEAPTPPRTLQDIRGLHSRIEDLTRQLARLRADRVRTSSFSNALTTAVRRSEQRIDSAIARYNTLSPGLPERKAQLATLKSELRTRMQLDRDIARSRREASAVVVDILHLRSAARRLISRSSEGRPTSPLRRRLRGGHAPAG